MFFAGCLPWPVLDIFKIALVKTFKADSTQKMLAISRCRFLCLPVCYPEISSSSSSGWRYSPVWTIASRALHLESCRSWVWIHRYSEAHCGSSQQWVFLGEDVLIPSHNPLPGAAGYLFLSVTSLLNSLARET